MELDNPDPSPIGYGCHTRRAGSPRTDRPLLCSSGNAANLGRQRWSTRRGEPPGGKLSPTQSAPAAEQSEGLGHICEATDLDSEQWEGARAQETPSFSSEALNFDSVFTPTRRSTSLPPWKIKTVGIAEIRSPPGVSWFSSVFTLPILTLPSRTPRRVFQSSARAYGTDHTKEPRSRQSRGL